MIFGKKKKVLSILQIQKLFITINGRDIVNNLNLNIFQNEIHILMGPNGSGKSTLAKVLAGSSLYTIKAEYIKFCKQRIIDNKLEKNVNILLQDVFEYISLDKFDYIIFSESAPLMSKKFLYKITNHVSDNLLLENGKIIFINNLIENPSLIVKFCKPLLKYIIWTDFGRILKKKEFEELANSLDKKISFEIIGAMSLSNIAKYFKYDYLYWIFNNIGLTNYDIEQYSITLE